MNPMISMYERHEKKTIAGEGRVEYNVTQIEASSKMYGNFLS
jgi:hypothetical protein